MKIKYFAWIKDITNLEEENLNSGQIKNLDELKLYIVKKYPGLSKHMERKILRIAVNQEHIVKNINLNNNDEIAIFPPVSGG